VTEIVALWNFVLFFLVAVSLVGLYLFIYTLATAPKP